MYCVISYYPWYVCSKQLAEAHHLFCSMPIHVVYVSTAAACVVVVISSRYDIIIMLPNNNEDVFSFLIVYRAADLTTLLPLNCSIGDDNSGSMYVIILEE